MSSSAKQTRQNLAATTDLTDRFEILANYMNRASNSSRIFTKLARFMMFAVIGLGIEFAVTAASLMAVNAAFAIGNALIKTYKWLMGGVAAAVASAAAALSIAAAAQREYTAAQMAYSQKATPKFGSAMDYSMAMIRNLTADTELAVFGVENLNAAFVAVGKNSQFTGKTQAVIRALRDFAAIGGDPGKSLAGIGNFVGLLQKEGKVTSKVSEAAKAIGPEFEKAFKKIKQSGGGVQEIFKSILSGDMSKSAGITGQADLLSGTLFGMFKKYKTLLTGLFGDIGQPLLGPAKEALERIFNIIKNGLLRVSPAIKAFGEVMLPTIVKSIEKLTDFTVKLFNKYLPQSEGMLGQIRQFWLDFKLLFGNITESLNKLRAGGSIVIDMFAKPLKELFKGIGENVEAFSKLAVDNKEDFLKFGDSMGDVVDALMDFSKKFKEAFTAALPTINTILTIVEKVIKGITMIMGVITSIPSIGGELITGIAGYGMIKGRRSAQRAAYRNGKTPRGRVASMADAATSLIGLPRYAGYGFESMFDINGNKLTSNPANNRTPVKGMFGRKTVSTGKLGGRIFKNGRLPRLARAMDSLGGQMNTYGASQAAMEQYDFFNEHDYDDKKVNRVPKGTPGAKYSKKHKGYITRGGYVKGAPKKTGMAKKLGRAKAGMRGGFGMGGMVAGASIAALTNSQYAPSMLSENAGAINMGAGLMAINPALGLGVMGAGTLINLMKGTGARTAGGGALTGAASGAAVGAALGSVVPFFGTAAGAIGGAIIGGVIGFFGGKKAEKMVAKEAAKAFAYNKLGDAVSKFITGDTKGAQGVVGKLSKDAKKYNAMTIEQQGAFITDLERKGIIGKTQAKRARQNKSTFGDELTSQASNMKLATQDLSKSFEDLMNGLQGSTGMSREAIMELAKSMGVNLYEPTLRLTDAIGALGKQMDLTVKGLAQSGTDALLKSYSVLDKMREKEKVTYALNAAAKGIEQAGGGSRDQYIDLMQKTSEYLANTNADDPLKQLYGFQDTFDVGGAAFRKNGALSTVGRADFNNNAGKQYEQIRGAQVENLATSRSQGIMQLINEGGFEFTDGAAGFAGIKSQLSSMYGSKDPEQRKKARALENFLISGSGLGASEDDIMKKLTSLGFDVTAGGGLKGSTAGTLSDQLEGAAVKMRTDIVDAIGSGFSDKPDWWTGRPGWWGNDGTGTDDTSSPRASTVGDTVSSRLGRTMSRHNQFNSMLTGKRTITSAWRNHSLGSPSSDHVTGNAYDLTGQNLGQYSSLIKNAGGFAEFHGAAGSRHLHVVPPAGPSGDTGTSRIGMAAPMALPQPSGGAVTINVYASEGQNEQEIARMVMDEINRSQRNYKERR
jgi:hypothetical protein